MGQCMQITVTATKIHPFLGYLLSCEQKNKKYLKLQLPVIGQQNYIQWLKNINKLRYSSEVKDILYLPKSQKFNNSQNLCSAGQYIEIILEPYFQTLKETIHAHIKTKRHFQESFIWYLIYVMVKYVKFNQKQEIHTDSLCYDNVLIFYDGNIRIIPENIIPDKKYLQNATLYLYDDNQETMDTFDQRTKKSKEEEVSPIYKMGMICLCLIDLKEPSKFYDPSHREWNYLNSQIKKSILGSCQKRYSSLLLQTIREMVEDTQQKRISPNALYKRMQIFQNEIIAKKQLGLGLNLGNSSIDSIKTSFCFQNKTCIANNSNVLRTSSVNGDHSTLHDVINEEIEYVHEQKDNFFSIL